MKLDLTPAEAAAVLRKRQQRDLRKSLGTKLGKRPAPPKEDDGSGFMGWVHDCPCIACRVLDGAPQEYSRIEAAHQKLNVASRGWHKRAGRRGPHWQCVPLCAWHHRLGPVRCDPAQAKFWTALGLELEMVCDFNAALVAAYRTGQSGEWVVTRYAAMALANLSEHAPAQQAPAPASANGQGPHSPHRSNALPRDTHKQESPERTRESSPRQVEGKGERG